MLKKLFSRFFLPASTASPTPLEKIGHMLLQTRDEEVSCDDVYAVLDEFAERKARGEDVAHLMSLVAHHLEMCIACREELEALLAILQSEA